MKKFFSVLLASVLAASVLPMTVAADDTAIVTDGLVANFEGTAGAQANTDVWTDTVNGYELEAALDDTNYWNENAFHVDSAYNYFPDEIVELVNSDKFTAEIALGELEYPGTSYISFIISDNDNFSLFIRTEGDFIEFKGSGNARPKVEGGADYANNSTLSVTFDIDGDVVLYVDGVEIGRAMTTENIVADTLFLGHYDAARNWIGDVYSIRFYDRALTAEEVAQNAASDNAKYRGGAAVSTEVPAAEDAGFTMTVDKTVFEYGEDIMVTSTTESLTDWIGIYSVDDTLPGYGDGARQWFYAYNSDGEPWNLLDGDGTEAGQPLEPGDYYLYFLFNDGYDIGKTIEISIVDDSSAAATETVAIEAVPQDYPTSDPIANNGAGYATLDEAVASLSKTAITGVTAVTGTAGFANEGPENLWDNDTATKFCANTFPTIAIAELDGEYAIDGIIMATANDNAEYNNRSPYEWAVYGSNDGSAWTALAYGDDYFFEETNFTYYAAPLTTEGTYKYVMFQSEGGLSGTFQVSELVLTGTKVETAAPVEEVAEEPVVEEPVVEETPVVEEAVVVEEPVVEETVEEVVVEEAVVEETVEEVAEEAAQTFDFGVIAAVAALVSAAGYAISKKR